MRILILGGTGLIGPHVLVGLGAEHTTTMTRKGQPRFCEKALKGDRNDHKDIAQAIRRTRPDLVIDMIPFTLTGASAMCHAMVETGCEAHVIALSSMDVYAGFGRLHGTEDAPHQPCPLAETATLRQNLGPEGTAYDKIGVESTYREHLANLTILRMPVVYGWPDCTRVETYLNPMLNGDPVIKMPRDVMEFRISRALHQNAAHAVILAARARQPGQHVYNVAEADAYTEADWLRKIAKLVGWHGKIEPMAPRWGSGPIQHLIADTTAIREELGYEEVVSPAKALRDNVMFHAYQRCGGSYQKGY